ncbi:hypothetical protein GJ496_005451 [Pomphorhynchus laevis]|nr:hypothetical protein GJ496_005451 [Pomphorhynchus laevis]
MVVFTSSDDFTERIVRFFSLYLKWLPSEACVEDQYRVNTLFFALSGLNLISTKCHSENAKIFSLCEDIIDWVKSNAIYKTNNSQSFNEINNQELKTIYIKGFTGGNTFSFVNYKQTESNMHVCNEPHLTMTHLCILVNAMHIPDAQLNNDMLISSKACSLFKSLWTSRNAIGDHLKSLQNQDGSISASSSCRQQCDMRFVYSACSICYCLNIWHSIDTSLLLEFISNCFNFDGGFGFSPGLESHGASTYLAIASLYLYNSIDEFFQQGKRIDKLLRWCALRQTEQGGISGRPGKIADSCYTFWIGASLSILNRANIINNTSCLQYVTECAHFQRGGFSKFPDTSPDMLHTFCSLAGITLLMQHHQHSEQSSLVLNEFFCDLKEKADFHAALCISEKAISRMNKLKDYLESSI